MIDLAALAASLDAEEEQHLDDAMRTRILAQPQRARRVTVLLHGLTASPKAWETFAEQRHARGEAVLVPRLPRHGYADRDTETLAGLRADELIAGARRMLDVAAALGERITLVGFSLGGSLALHLAHEDARIERVIAVAPFIGIAKLPHEWHRLVRLALERLPNRFVYWDPVDRGRSDPPHGYPRYATRAIAAAFALADALRADARRGPPKAQHVELVRNAFETAISNRSIDDLVARWRAAGGSAVRTHRIIGLGPSHDIIEPTRKRSQATRFLPHLHALLDAGPAERDLIIDAR